MPHETLPLSSRTPLAVGDTVEVLWKEAWYVALVLLIEPGGAVHVHFSGWAREWDSVVPRERIRVEVEWSPLPAEGGLEQGARVRALWDGTWYDAEVLAEEAGGVRLHYLGWKEEHDGLVERERLRLPVRKEPERPDPRAKPLGRQAGVPPAVGTLVEACWEGGWYAAVVLGSGANSVRVRYVGFGVDWDEDVALDRIRIGADLEVLETRSPPKP